MTLHFFLPGGKADLQYPSILPFFFINLMFYSCMVWTLHNCHKCVYLKQWSVHRCFSHCPFVWVAGMAETGCSQCFKETHCCNSAQLDLTVSPHIQILICGSAPWFRDTHILLASLYCSALPASRKVLMSYLCNLLVLGNNEVSRQIRMTHPDPSKPSKYLKDFGIHLRSFFPLCCIINTAVEQLMLWCPLGSLTRRSTAMTESYTLSPQRQELIHAN